MVLLLGASHGTRFDWALLRGGSLIRQLSKEKTLVIKKADPTNDFGIYRCQVENEQGALIGAAYTAVTVGFESHTSPWIPPGHSLIAIMFIFNLDFFSLQIPMWLSSTRRPMRVSYVRYTRCLVRKSPGRNSKDQCRRTLYLWATNSRRSTSSR